MAKNLQEIQQSLENLDKAFVHVQTTAERASRVKYEKLNAAIVDQIETAMAEQKDLRDTIESFRTVISAIADDVKELKPEPPSLKAARVIVQHDNGQTTEYDVAGGELLKTRSDTFLFTTTVKKKMDLGIAKGDLTINGPTIYGGGGSGSINDYSVNAASGGRGETIAPLAPLAKDNWCPGKDAIAPKESEEKVTMAAQSQTSAVIDDTRFDVPELTPVPEELVPSAQNSVETEYQEAWQKAVNCLHPAIASNCHGAVVPDDYVNMSAGTAFHQPIFMTDFPAKDLTNCGNEATADDWIEALALWLPNRFGGGFNRTNDNTVMIYVAPIGNFTAVIIDNEVKFAFPTTHWLQKEEDNVTASTTRPV